MITATVRLSAQLQMFAKEMPLSGIQAHMPPAGNNVLPCEVT